MAVNTGLRYCAACYSTTSSRVCQYSLALYSLCLGLSIFVYLSRSKCEVLFPSKIICKRYVNYGYIYCKRYITLIKRMHIYMLSPLAMKHLKFHLDGLMEARPLTELGDRALPLRTTPVYSFKFKSLSSSLFQQCTRTER